MDESSRTAKAGPKPGFLREGWRELLRRRERGKLRKQAQKSDEERNSALVRLGENAWNANVDLSTLPELREQLTRLTARAGELTAAARKLEEEKAALEAQRQAESSRFDSLQQAVLEKKRPVDAALTAARERLAQQDAKVKELPARLASLATELAALEKEIASPPANSTPEQIAQQSALQKRKQELQLEQTLASQELAKTNLALPQASAEVRRNYEESQRHEQELTKITAERKAALAPIESSLDRVARDRNAASQEAGGVALQRRAVHAQLGLGLYERRSAEPALAAGMLEVAGIDLSRANTQAGLEASLAASRAIPRGTMLKFWSTLVFLPLLLIASVYGISAGWSWWQERHQPKRYETSVPINPYLVHSLSQNSAYALANRMANASSEREVADRMLDAFRAIHLGVYTRDGKQILAGSERSAKDFYLYDFQLRILAHSFFQHNSMDFDDHSRMLGAALLHLDHPENLTPLLKRAVLLRYKDAVKQPDNPKNFLILLVDGLARNQFKPYSLSEIEARPGEDLDVDALQSFLIMLDFFTEPQSNAGRSSSLIWFPWNWVSTVHAQNPCVGVEGDGSESEWGDGVEKGITAAEQGGEVGSQVLRSETTREVLEKIHKGAEGIGTAIDVATGISDLATLYGIDITVKPSPEVIHLRHSEDQVIGVFFAYVGVDLPVKDYLGGGSNTSIPCGPMQGEAIPVTGEPLKNVELTWNIVREWPDYLTVPHEEVGLLTGHQGFQTKTDLNGKSTFVVEAGECIDKQGTIVGQDFRMKVTARVLTTKTPSLAFGVEGPAAIASLIAKLVPGGIEYVMNGRKGYCPFRVEWHEKKPKKPQRGGDPNQSSQPAH